ncbi:MAG: histidinol-phosphate transaminase [Candidatus Competibacteraceae bacterium]|nr:histidinol-phosphate transaminase [Candidatus Competibacteraceae bacterium]
MKKLNANENFYGCSPKVLDAIQHCNQTLWQYPTHPQQLENALATIHNVLPEQIIIGSGSVRLIDAIIQSCVEPQEEVVIFENSFIAYEQICEAHRRSYHKATQRNFVCHPDAIFPLLNNKTKVVFISNPNNPTGTIISHEQLENLLKNIPSHLLVVADEAYVEYVTDDHFPRSLSLMKSYPNLIVLRTFSKVYGLAGLRIGYAIADLTVAKQLKKFRIPFFLNTYAETAALAALQDQSFIQNSIRLNQEERIFLHHTLQQIGLNPVPSQTNFIYIPFEDEDKKNALHLSLQNQGILVANMLIFGQKNSLRITIPNHETVLEICQIIHSVYSSQTNSNN